MNIIEQKRLLRKEMFEKRKHFNPAQKQFYDAWVCNELDKIIQTRSCKVVHSYIPLSGEINVLPLIEKLLEQNIKVVCPKTLPNRVLENRVLVSLNELETGVMRTQHPSGKMIYEGNYDLIIVPGLAYDINNYRLGYGGGYYDNFLTIQKSAYKVGIFYPFQKVNVVPRESHDIKLDTVLVNESLTF